MHPTVDLKRAGEVLGLRERIASVPAGAAVRGVWFSTHLSYVGRLGQPTLLVFERAVNRRKRLPFLMYPLTEYLEELAAAATVVDPGNPAEGLRRIWRDAIPAYLATPFGRPLVRLIGSPMRYLKWLTAHRDHFCTYGTWWLEERGPGYAVMEIRDEYVWVETAQRGGGEGVLRAFGVDGAVEPELTSPYSGRLHIRWSERLH